MRKKITHVITMTHATAVIKVVIVARMVKRDG